MWLSLPSCCKRKFQSGGVEFFREAFSYLHTVTIFRYLDWTAAKKPNYFKSWCSKKSFMGKQKSSWCHLNSKNRFLSAEPPSVNFNWLSALSLFKHGLTSDWAAEGSCHSCVASVWSGNWRDSSLLRRVKSSWFGVNGWTHWGVTCCLWLPKESLNI